MRAAALLLVLMVPASRDTDAGGGGGGGGGTQTIRHGASMVTIACPERAAWCLTRLLDGGAASLWAAVAGTSADRLEHVMITTGNVRHQGGGPHPMGDSVFSHAFSTMMRTASRTACPPQYLRHAFRTAMAEIEVTEAEADAVRRLMRHGKSMGASCGRAVGGRRALVLAPPPCASTPHTRRRHLPQTSRTRCYRVASPNSAR